MTDIKKIIKNIQMVNVKINMKDELINEKFIFNHIKIFINYIIKFIKVFFIKKFNF
jgi:hypothetical protein